MYYVNADARDGGASNMSACNTCCCAPIFLRPGELGLVQVNYAPWVLPIAPPGLIAGSLEYAVSADVSGCPAGLVDGFLPPSNTNYTLTTAVSTLLPIDLSDNAGPAGNGQRYELVPFSGPSFGTLVQTADGGPLFNYTPASGYTGYDYFSYKMTDDQGRSIIRSVRVSVGVHSQVPDSARMSLLPFVDVSRSKVNTRLYTLQFPIQMPISCRPCDNWRLTIKQSAMDCQRNVFNHSMCFDLACKDCG